MPAHLDAIVKAYRGTSKRAAGSGTATNTPEAEDVSYLTNVAIGTPAQTLPLDFDTGSSDLWVFSSETPSDEVNGQKTYDAASSTTAKQLSGATWSISYGDGSSSSGNVYTDTVTIGNLTYASQAVEAATTVSDEFTEDSANSGLVGLAMSSLNTVSPTAQNTFFDNIKSTLTSPLFVANLNHDAPGTYTFGAIDFTGTVLYADLYNTSQDLSGYWTFQSTGYARAVTLTDETITGIADTGTTLLMLPDDVVAAYYAQVSGAEDSTAEGGYVFPCDSTMPDFSFGVGDGAITVPGDYINWSAVDTTNTTCYGGLQSDASIGFSIFGDIALKSAYVVFDGGEQRVGWAQKASV
ncbi:peptidase A1 [Cryphonectria parasitica EP155]|uniref:Peptidase A1 n=1 Tax=Cryphonectria parasitica (strain ATCC 38755 / EP155) TaxID=660469 RepID=A0A9P4XUE1_CRYP1|nr:peptidase A1 [Cryphonectria parasitica EP155]KAF3761159.1 peptidase A1 [Cryphonectria parasitica EP155]